MTGWFWAGLVTGLAANECCALSDWTARGLVRWSAHVRYDDPERAKIRAEELVAVVAERPCQLLKLITAACFVVSALRAWTGRATSGVAVTGVSISGAGTLRLTAAMTIAITGVAALTLYTAGPGPAPRPAPYDARPAPTAPHWSAAVAVRAVSFAESQIGTPYVFGGASPAGYDCSGLVMAAWAKAGVQIPRTTYEQWHTLPHVPTADLEPGDLLFYNEASHVAIYAGNGEIIDAPHAGADVEEIPMSTHRYAASFDGAARP